MPKIEQHQVPDTLTLEERAELALNALIGVADEDYEYIPFFNGNFKAKPAYMTHGNWDFGSSHGRLVDAVILARAMTGSDFGADVEMHYRRNLLSFFRKDGLNYRRNTFTEDIITEHMAEFVESAGMIDQRSVLLGLTTWFIATGDEGAKEAADKLCAGLKRIARKERDSWYYPASEWTEKGWPSFDAVHTRLAPDPAAMWGRQIGPLYRYYRITGNMDAYDLAENFAANIIHRSGVFNADGSFNGALGYRNGHFHTRMGTLASLAVFGYHTRDASIIEFVKKSYDWALTQCTAFGWTPGDMHDQRFEHETCTLVDAVHTGIILARSGYPEYWGCVERFLRNHLTESQLVDIDWIEELDHKGLDIPKQRTYYKVAQRLRGAFSGYAAPNDFVYDGEWGRGHIMDVQTCCLGAGTRGLYVAWSSIVTEDSGRVWINLLLNHTSRWLTMKSWMPHEGRIDLEIRQGIPELLIRIPEWVPFGTVRMTVEGSGETTTKTGRQLPWVKKVFMKLGALKEGTRVTITFPLNERRTVEVASGLEYDVKWRGDDVIRIDPPGTYYPLYTNRRIQAPAGLKPKVLACDEGPALV